MPYELFTDKAARLGSPALTITTDGRLSLNADAGDIMREAKARFVQLLWDREEHRIALRPVSRIDEHSYRLTSAAGRKRGMALSAKSFLRHIEWDFSKTCTLPVSWNEKDKMLVAVLPSEHGSKLRT